MHTKKKIILTLTAATLGLGMGVVAPSASADPAGMVRMHDDCDPATFNAAVGPGTCVVNGGTTFNDFLAQLGAKGKATGWTFRPRAVRVMKGDTVVAVNTGGETHSFTRVAAFGGGCVKPINDILGLTPVPECTQTVMRDGKPVNKFAATLVPSGGSRTAKADQTGTIKFECLIHPWMHAELRVS